MNSDYGLRMTWKYGLVKSDEGVKVAEIYSNGGYAMLDKNDWWFDDKSDAIATLEQIISDLKDK